MKTTNSNRAIENIHRLTAAALALGFVMGRHTMFEMLLHRQTVKGIMTLHCISDEGPLCAQLNWEPDNEVCRDFSIIPFNIAEEADSECVDVNQFEMMVRQTLEFHHDRFVA